MEMQLENYLSHSWPAWCTRSSSSKVLVSDNSGLLHHFLHDFLFHLRVYLYLSRSFKVTLICSIILSMGSFDELSESPPQMVCCRNSWLLVPLSCTYHLERWLFPLPLYQHICTRYWSSYLVLLKHIVQSEALFWGRFLSNLINWFWLEYVVCFNFSYSLWPK